MADHRTPVTETFSDECGFGEVHIQAKQAPYVVRVRMLDVSKDTAALQSLLGAVLALYQDCGKFVTLVVDMRDATGDMQTQADVFLNLAGSVVSMVDIVRSTVTGIMVLAPTEIVEVMDRLVTTVNRISPPKEGGIPRTMFKIDDPESSKDMVTALAALGVP
jgi:hypothetical protein